MTKEELMKLIEPIGAVTKDTRLLIFSVKDVMLEKGDVEVDNDWVKKEVNGALDAAGLKDVQVVIVNGLDVTLVDR
jgi:hypothetical protein